MSHQQYILLVEDSRTQALNLGHVLEQADCSVRWAPTVEAAMEQLNQASPDLIVLDYYLPGIPGDELCRRIRMNIDTRNIPILMLTTDATHHAELRGLESGADDFVPKSADPAVLLARVRTLLSKPGLKVPIPGLSEQRFRRARLLTIDDSPTYQQYLIAELEQEGYQIEKAMCGAEGLVKLLREPFDCALVDLVMPEMDGIAVCRQVRSTQRLTDDSLALLMLTGQETKEDLTQALEAGADDFVGKSSDMAVLKGRIRALLRRKFCQEDNRRIVEELKSKEVELVRARSEKDVAEARAALNAELEQRVEERTAQLAKANRELAQQTHENEMFVYSVSHDLRAPLVNLQGFGGELKATCQEVRKILAESTLPPEAKQHGLALVDDDMATSIRFIQSAVLRLSNIVNALLQLSRAGRIEYAFQPVDTQTIVARVVDSFSATIAERNAAVELGGLPMVWGDPTAIERVIANLIGNALNYLDPSRPGRIEVGSLPPEPQNASGGCGSSQTIYVRDNGLGIPAAYREKIFQIFQRLHPQVAGGEGIGLAIVLRVVARHGGKVWFESVAGQGTTFFVSLPAPAEQPAPTCA
jgi:two-component system NtrC family sensor kinase